jgi:hypothetical protein
MKAMTAIIFTAYALGAQLPAQAALSTKPYHSLPSLKQQYGLNAADVEKMRVWGHLTSAQLPQGDKVVAPSYFMADLYYGNPHMWQQGLNDDQPYSRIIV